MSSSSVIRLPVEPPPAPLRVLLAADADFSRRFGRMLRQFGLGLNDAGLTVQLVTDDRAALAELEATPIEPVGCSGLHGWRSWRLASELDDEVERAPDLVHVWGARSFPALARWAARRGRPLLVHALSVRDVERLRGHRARPGEYAAAGCGAFQAQLRAHWPVERVTRVIPPALFITEDLSGKPARELRGTLGILWDGRVDRESGLATLLDAVGQLRAQQRDVQLVLIGNGPAEHAFWRTIRARGLSDCVSLIGERRLWNSAIWGADVYVVPAPQTELSLGPLLAMALARIVIAARGQPAEWFIDNETAWLFAPRAANELAGLLARAADDAAAARALAARSAQYVRDHHAVSRLTVELAAVYAEIVAADRAARPAHVDRRR